MKIKSEELALQTTNNLQSLNVNDLARMSKMFYESGMFSDANSAAQVAVKIQAGQELGIPPFQAISGIHIIKGKPTVGAGLMASMLDRHPEYDFEVLQQNDKVCEIKFFKNGKAKGTSKFTAEDARKAGTQNMGKFPQNMLYARAISNGVKWYAPGLFAGPVYVPEEMQSIEQEPEVESTYEEVTSVHESKLVRDSETDKKSEQAELSPEQNPEPEQDGRLDDVISSIETASTLPELGRIHTEYTDLHNNNEFMKALKKRRAELSDKK